MPSSEDCVTINISDNKPNETTFKINHCTIVPSASDLKIEEMKRDEEERQFEFIVRTVRLLSAGIGNTKKANWLGWIGRVLWILNIIIHFGLDFYEAKFVFHVSWASTVALFLIALVSCSVNAIKYSLPWFVKGLRKLTREKKYPKTLRRLSIYFKVLRVLIIPLSVGAAMAQFGCYAYDDALDLNFNGKSSASNHSAPGYSVPQSVTVMVNVLRATSLVHIFYGFWFFLLTHMGMVYMIQSSMDEYIELMAKALRESPVVISFSEAVNSFAARSRFVQHGSSNITGVFTVLLVVCSTSFVLNAYNYLFLKKYAIYIWFALAPVIWAVTPLIGAAWVTRHYQRYKLVVVNAWVDVPDDEVEEQIDEDITEPSESLRENPGVLRRNGSKNEGKNYSVEKMRKSRSLSDLYFSNSSLAQNFSLDVPVSQIATRTETRNSQNDYLSRANNATGKRFESGYENVAFRHKPEENPPTTVNSVKNTQGPKIEISTMEEPEQILTAIAPEMNNRSQASRVFSGIAKTYSRWRARVKAKRKFNFEKYITYLDITLPTIGFSIGGVVITWDAVSGFCFLLFTLVGIFAQEAFFGG